MMDKHQLAKGVVEKLDSAKSDINVAIMLARDAGIDVGPLSQAYNILHKQRQDINAELK